MRTRAPSAQMPGDAGDASDAGEEPPQGSIELCVLNERDPFDTCPSPEDLTFGNVGAGKQEKRLFRLDNELLEEATFEQAYVNDPDFEILVGQYVPDPAPPHNLVREPLTLPQTRPPSSSLFFDVVFTSKGKLSGPFEDLKAVVEITTASNEFIEIQIPIVGNQELCPAGMAACDENPNNGCETNLNTNREHCGSCGASCGAGEHCVNGTCRTECFDGWLECGNVCHDPKTSRDHCGGCNIKCSASDTCNDGVCVSCPSADVVCGNECRKTSPNTCSTATLLYSGNQTPVRYLPHSGQEHWYQVSFAETKRPGTGRPTIEFTHTDNTAFRFDLYSNCGGSGLTCGDGQTALNRDEYTFHDDCSSDSCKPDKPQEVSWPTTVLVRVKRVGGAACDGYRLRVSR